KMTLKELLVTWALKSITEPDAVNSWFLSWPILCSVIVAGRSSSHNCGVEKSPPVPMVWVAISAYDCRIDQRRLCLLRRVEAFLCHITVCNSPRVPFAVFYFAP